MKRKNSLPADSADWSPGPDGRMGISLRSFPCHALQNAMRAFLLSASSDGKGENLKYSLLVHSQRRFHYNLVTAHVINAGLTYMSNKMLFQVRNVQFHLFTAMLHNPSLHYWHQDAQPAEESHFRAVLCHGKDSVSKSYTREPPRPAGHHSMTKSP